MSKKAKLVERLMARPKDFTWDETRAVMKASNFEMIATKGSGRMFVHRVKRNRVRLHEPHPRKTLLPYVLDILIEGLTTAGEI